MNHKMFVVMALLMVFLGCERTAENQDRNMVEAPEDHDGMLCLGFDMSGSFSEMIASDDGRAGRFALACVNEFVKNRSGNRDRVVLFQISGNADKPLLFDGTPADFRREFGNPAKFRDYLAKHSNPAGSPIYRGIAEALEYVMSYHERLNTKMVSATLIFSDFDDNDSDGANQYIRLEDALKRYAKFNPAIGFYWVNTAHRTKYERLLKDCGFNGVVSSGIVSNPPLPKFK